MFSRPLIKIIRNSNALNVTGLIPKPQSLLLSRTFFTTQFKLESFPSLPSPPSFPTTTTLNSSGVSPTSSPLDSDHVPKQPIKHAIGKIERRLQITFTCTATIDQPEIEGVTPPEVIVEDIEVEEITCGHRSTHEFSKRSYDHGIVLIECPGCKNRHLIGKLLFLSISMFWLINPLNL